MLRNISRIRAALALAAAIFVLAPQDAGWAQQDDTALFSVAVPPNVLLLIDNSGSMNHAVWHPQFDPTLDPTCTNFTNDTTYTYNADITPITVCGKTINLYFDPGTAPFSNRITGRYLNWLFSPESNPYNSDVESNNNGTFSACLGGGTFSKYRRTRITAAKHILRDVICQVNAAGEVRFGLATFRVAGDPNGGYVRVPINDYLDAAGGPNVYTLNGISQSHGDHLDDTIEAIDANTWTPLGETLFQVFTYFLSRNVADIPFGKDGATKFPEYEYDTSSAGAGGAPTATPPISPVQWACQKNFIIVITDGEPTRDDFDEEGGGTDEGFDDFTADLIGDYNLDGEDEEPGSFPGCVNCEAARYLDDIAKWMQDNDFRPDLDGDQVIDTYTVGFTTSAWANAVLQKTAEQGGGVEQFFFSNNAEELALALVAAITDIIQKSQSFTAATVPATRTASGGNLYTSLFVPTDKSPYWEGHLSAYEITADGQLKDALGNCLVDDPTPGECFSGPILATAVPFWDAADEVPSPAVRTLYTSMLVGPPGNEVSTRVAFNTSLTAADLGVTFPPATAYNGSIALNDEELADEIVMSTAGCNFGTGVSVACVIRDPGLGDIFHSSPVVIGSPSGFTNEPSYLQFQSNLFQRDRMIYAGANDGFFHGFHAGEWDPLAVPPGHDRGTGTEVFGFMPWWSRTTIKNKHIDSGARDWYFVDASPSGADVWWWESSVQQATKAADGSEWHTVVVGGLRQGGEAYYAMDVSDPDDPSYPELLWEFPAENAPAAISDYVAQTWSEPIITKIRVKLSNGNDNFGQGFERWVAIVGGGYDPSGDPNDFAAYDPQATEGRGAFIIDIKTGQLVAEMKFDPSLTTPGTDPSTFPYDANNPRRSMHFAMPATPAVYDLDFDGYADTIYQVDLGGRVWKWVIKDFAIQNTTGTYQTNQPNWKIKKFFQAPVYDSGTNKFYKSFFFPPGATFKSGKLWLAMGTGERANLPFEGDSGTTGDNNRFYAMTDLDPFEKNAAPYPTLVETDLLDVTGNETCADVSAYRGYFFVGAEGEKWVTNVDVFFYFVFVASYIPEPAVDPCEAGGKAFLYVFKIYCGEGFFVDGGGNENRSVELGAGMPTDPKITISPEDGGNRVIITQQEGEIQNLETPPGFGSGIGQFYWRELSP